MRHESSTDGVGTKTSKRGGEMATKQRSTSNGRGGSTVRESKSGVVEILQALLPSMNDLYLQTRQAHWNVVGPRFFSVHKQLEAIYTDLAAQADEVAERIRQLGDTVDGSAAHIDAETKLAKLKTGALKDDDAVRLIAERIATVVKEMRRHLDDLDEQDPPTQDILNGIIHRLEEHHWMLGAQLER